jgi:hypothetical protein
MADELGKPALDERVLIAMAKVPRHEFVPIEDQSYAYLNRPIPIGFDKTISQPLMVAVMTDLVLQTDGERIQREIEEYAALSRQVMQLTKTIAESVQKVRAAARVNQAHKEAQTHYSREA